MTPNISSQLSAQLDASNRVAHILWFALMMSVVIYGGVTFIIAGQGGEGTGELALPPLVFAALAVSSALTGVMMYRQLTSPDRIRAVLSEPRTVEQEYARMQPTQQSPEMRARLQALSAAELRLNRVPGLVFTASIVRWALFESVAIFGLVLAINSRSFEAFLPYGITAIALQAMSPPRLKQITLSAIALMPADVSTSKAT